MITDTELRLKGTRALAQSLGDIEAERFIALIQREPFDYTQWRQDKWEDLSIEEISRKAMMLRENSVEQTDRADGEDTAAQP
ncbi:MAG: hypothetical protein GY856_01710 [bacterium]|nr:hypothetical protein [bacterium]